VFFTLWIQFFGTVFFAHNTIFSLLNYRIMKVFNQVLTDMKVFDEVMTDNLNEVLDLKAEIKLQEDKYASLLDADQPFEILKEIRLNIKYLKDNLIMTEKHALTLLEI